MTDYFTWAATRRQATVHYNWIRWGWPEITEETKGILWKALYINAHQRHGPPLAWLKPLGK